MSIAKLAYLTSPGPGRYMLNIQMFGSDELQRFEIGPDHMRNILSDGVPLMLKQSLHRVPVITNTEDANERAGRQSA
jgi:hypothetical protein